jgi:aldose 1-epimerase
LKREDYRSEVDGRAVDLYFLRNARGMVVALTNWGARIEQILVPDREGAFADVSLGYDTLAQAMAGQSSMGAFIGRFANRIANARFTLDGVEYTLAANSGPNPLHGGVKGSRFRVFETTQESERSVVMRYTFEDGEEGFPGTLPVVVRYTLDDDNGLALEYEATALGKPTIANFTGHAFFNLAGHASGDILGHVLHVNADKFLPTDATSIPTGEFRRVHGTPMDFRIPMAIGARIDCEDEQLKLGCGYDHHYVLNKKDDEESLAARVVEPVSGRVMEVWTTEPGLQVYSGNFLEGQRPRDVGKGGAVYERFAGFCLEPSRYPDAPNKPAFPSTVLRPGETYAGRTTYRFATLP